MDLMTFTLLFGEKKGVIHTSGLGTIEFTGAGGAAHGGANFNIKKMDYVMTNKKQSSPKLTSLAVNTLKDKTSSVTAKSLAASVLSQSNTSKQTGADMETKASRVLNSNKYNNETKSLAASILSQSDKRR